MNTPLRIIILVGLAILTLGGCRPPFEITTPDAMVELNESQWSRYEYRATTPNGVVVSARQIRQDDNPGSGEVPAGSLEFWIEAVSLRMRTLGGYALLSDEETRSFDGTSGRQLEFGRDQGDTPYRYVVAVFVTDRFVHVVEAGGQQDLFEENRDEVDDAISTYVCRR